VILPKLPISRRDEALHGLDGVPIDTGKAQDDANAPHVLDAKG
jgi:hypothetical protein